MRLTDTHSMDNGEPALPSKDIKEVLDNEIKWVHDCIFCPQNFVRSRDKSFQRVAFP